MAYNKKYKSRSRVGLSKNPIVEKEIEIREVEVPDVVEKVVVKEVRSDWRPKTRDQRPKT